MSADSLAHLAYIEASIDCPDDCGTLTGAGTVNWEVGTEGTNTTGGVTAISGLIAGAERGISRSNSSFIRWYSPSAF